MEEEKIYTVIGLMSGTSVDGIDAALIRTDGKSYVKRLDFITIPYEESFREKIKAQFGKSKRNSEVRDIEREMTLKHADIVKKIRTDDVDLIGFHGQTLLHDPDNGIVFQIGDGALLAQETGIDVVSEFRVDDVKAGGQGAPLIPLYHRALAEYCSKPCAFLNIGGVSNVTWIEKQEILAFDCGPGNALIDDVMMQEFGRPYDKNGLRALQGQVDEEALSLLMAHPFFERKPSKSLDRDSWDISCLDHLNAIDKITTLTEFTVRSIVKSQEHMSETPIVWYVCGGGRHNQEIMKGLSHKLEGELFPIDVMGENGDALEAEGFGYLAVRSVKGLPLSLPTTTGVPAPQTGGCYRKAG